LRWRRQLPLLLIVAVNTQEEVFGGTESSEVLRGRVSRWRPAGPVKQKGVRKKPHPFLVDLLGLSFVPPYILLRSGTMRSETMLMTLIMGLTAGPAVSL